MSFLQFFYNIHFSSYKKKAIKMKLEDTFKNYFYILCNKRIGQALEILF